MTILSTSKSREIIFTIGDSVNLVTLYFLHIKLQYLFIRLVKYKI